MEDWPKEFFKMLETAGQEMDRFLQEVTEEVEEFVDILGRVSSDIIELSEEFAEELQTTIFTEFDQYFEELVDPFFDLYLGLDEFPTDIDGFVSSVEPTAEKYAACIGCKNYHGQVYGGNLLVCGMHPYGWEADGDCPDWES